MKGIVNKIIAALCLCPACFAQQHTVLSVEDCRRMAVESSADTRNAALDCAGADLLKGEALSEYFPSLSAAGLAFHAVSPLLHITVTDVLGHSDVAYQMQAGYREWAMTNGLKTSYNALNYGYSGALTLTQPVYAGGRIVTGNRLASLGREAAKVKATLTRRNVCQQVDKAYYQILSLQEKQQTLDNIATLLDTVERDVRSAVAAGLAVSADLSQVLVQRSTLRAGQSRLEKGLRLAKMNLLNTIGVKYNPYEAVSMELPSLDSFTFTGSMDDLPSPQLVYVDENQVVASLSEMQLLDMQVKAEKLKKRMEVGQALPTVGLGASYGFSRMLDNPRWNGAVYAMVKIPITDWGKSSRRIGRAEIEVQKAENQREYLSAQLLLQLRSLYVELTGAWDQMQIAREKEAVATDAMRQMRSGYGAGMHTMTEFLQAQSALREASQERIDATLDYLSALQAYKLRTNSEE